MKRNIYEKLAMCHSEGEVRRILDGTSHVIVPVKPSEEMLMAVPLLVCGIDPSYSNHAVSRKVYKAMIKASMKIDTTPATAHSKCGRPPPCEIRRQAND